MDPRLRGDDKKPGKFDTLKLKDYIDNMLEQNDLQQIKDIVGKGFEDFAIIVNKAFEEQDYKFDKKLERLETNLEASLSSIRTQLYSIRLDIKRLEEKIDCIAKAGNEDILAFNNDVIILKKRVAELEEKVKVLEMSK